MATIAIDGLRQWGFNTCELRVSFQKLFQRYLLLVEKKEYEQESTIQKRQTILDLEV